MKWRDISEKEVLAALENPDRIEKSIMGRKNFYKLLGDRNIKVTCKEISEQVLVISAVDKGKRG